MLLIWLEFCVVKKLFLIFWKVFFFFFSLSLPFSLKYFDSIIIPYEQ